jgi:hypothetical protein
MALTTNLSRGNTCAIDMAKETAIGGGAADANQNIFMTAGRLFYVRADNSHSNRAYLKLYNSKSVTVGTTVPEVMIPLNGSGTDGGHTIIVVATGLKFDTAFSMAATASNDSTSTADPDDTTLAVDVVFAKTSDV